MNNRVYALQNSHPNLLLHQPMCLRYSIGDSKFCSLSPYVFSPNDWDPHSTSARVNIHLKVKEYTCTYTCTHVCQCAYPHSHLCMLLHIWESGSHFVSQAFATPLVLLWNFKSQFTSFQSYGAGHLTSLHVSSHMYMHTCTQMRA